MFISFVSDDRHRELDDLLSDMLMTVQDIPDISAQQSKTLKLNQSKGMAAIPTATQQKHLLAPNQSSSTSMTKQQTTHYISSSGNGGAHGGGAHGGNSSRDLYETSSTTTLTPPPSESGRDTPLARNKRDLELQQTERELIMSLSDQRSSSGGNGGGVTPSKTNLQQHSYLYPQQARVETLSITSDTDDDATNNIPYHAREDSRPFTYGITPSSGRSTPASAPAASMLKQPSGLSSPSMVRKALGGGGSYSEKAKPRNEFEEMLLERREKILNGDKYSIGDRTPNGSSANYESKWYTSTSGAPVNGYSHELLKRSNTMDGSFGRSLTPSEG